jgi:hypothetical protein
MGLVPSGRDHEVEVPLCEQGLTRQSNGGENRTDQRMPPKPATGFPLPSR